MKMQIYQKITKRIVNRQAAQAMKSFFNQNVFHNSFNNEIENEKKIL